MPLDLKKISISQGPYFVQVTILNVIIMQSYFLMCTFSSLHVINQKSYMHANNICCLFQMLNLMMKELQIIQMHIITKIHNKVPFWNSVHVEIRLLHISLHIFVNTAFFVGANTLFNSRNTNNQFLITAFKCITKCLALSVYASWIYFISTSIFN